MHNQSTLFNLSSSDLKKLASLKTKIETLESELQSILGGEISTPSKKRTMSASARAKIAAAQKARWAKIHGGKKRSAKSTGRGGHGELKARIIGELKAAGKQGISVKELADRLNTKYANISVWFPTTGKRVKEIRKIAPGRYAWRT